jgi:cysteine desulfurase/selenocysteine lyase
MKGKSGCSRRAFAGGGIMKTQENRKPMRPSGSYEVQKIRKDFPIFEYPVQNRALVYLDNAATTQKPRAVINAVTGYYTRECASIHRGIYSLSERATELYEASRVKAQQFIHAASCREIVFVSGATEAINLVAQTYGRMHLGPDDEILVSAMEHHSNIVPWQMLCREKGARLHLIPINPDGEIVLEQYERLLNTRTRLVAVTHVSNVLGTINPLREIIRMAHGQNIPVLVDGAQAVLHMPVDVQDLDCDFYVLSGHKMYGPTGIGVLYGKESLLEEMPPYQGGGDMIRSVTLEKTAYRHPPHKFEAGTPNIAGGIGLGAAIDYLRFLGLENIAAHEKDLTTCATRKLLSLNMLRLFGTAKEKAGILSFTLGDIHPHDIGTILDQEGIAIRTGQHCAQPVMDFFGIPATARISFGLYNTEEEINAAMEALQRVQEVFR